MGERGAVRPVDESLHGRAAIGTHSSAEDLRQSQGGRPTQHPDTRRLSGPAGEPDTPHRCRKII